MVSSAVPPTGVGWERGEKLETWDWACAGLGLDLGDARGVVDDTTDAIIRASQYLV